MFHERSAVSTMVKKTKLVTARLMAMTVVILILAACFTGCGMTTGKTRMKPGRYRYVPAFYVMYDFAGKIGGDKVTVTNLLPAGSDPHTWEPSPRDIVNTEC